MQCYTRLTPPTAVTHCVSLPFLSASANNLIVAKSSLLQIFSLKTVAEVPGRGSDSSTAQPRDRIHTTKLVLISQHELAGTVFALDAVKGRRTRCGGTALLVALKDAKLSLIEWDAERSTLSTISIHYYEKEDLTGPPWAPDTGQYQNRLTVDPSGSCAALKFGARNVAIIPFHRASDDLAMAEHSEAIIPLAAGKLTNGTDAPSITSFVLSLLAMDPALIYPADIRFLHGYREPTVGILSSQLAVSSNLLPHRRDLISYTVYTLDLEQRASTTLLSISGLPSDIHRVHPLPPPIGGALLLGHNEVIHVDQAGRTTGLSVNEFGRHSSSVCESPLKLERCVVESLNTTNGAMLMILQTGELAILDFVVDGRTVTGLTLRKIDPSHKVFRLSAAASCTTNIGRGRMFVGSEEGDSCILGWSANRGRQQPTNGDDVEALDEEFEDEDELYADAKAPTSSTTHADQSESEGYNFRIHDTLMSIAPINAISFHARPNGSPGEKEMILASGLGRAGALARLSMEINPRLGPQYDMGRADRVWALCCKSTGEEALPQHETGLANVLICSRTGEEEETHIFDFHDETLTEKQGTDFEPSAGAALEFGVFAHGTRVIQVLETEVRIYDGDFGLTQIQPMSEDGDEGGAVKVTSCSLVEPYVLLLKDDSSIMLLKLDGSGDFDVVEAPESFSQHWQSACLFDDLNDIFRLEASQDDDEEPGTVLMFLLGVGGDLQTFHMANLTESVYTAPGLGFLPPFLASDFSLRRNAVRDNVAEILVAEIGDSVYKAPYLFVRSVNEELTIYQPYQHKSGATSTKALRFLKIPHQYQPRATAGDAENQRSRERLLRPLADLDGYSVVFVSGSCPSFVLRSPSHHPQVIGLNSPGLKSLTEFRGPSHQGAYISVNIEGGVSVGHLPKDADYSNGWVLQRLIAGEEICALSFHEKSDRVVLGAISESEFKLPTDELHPEWSDETTKFLPDLQLGTLKLFDMASAKVTDDYPLDPGEVVMCIKTMILETSEITHERKPLVVVGSAIVQGTDLSQKGRLYVFDIIDVVPKPDQPETGRKLKLISKEDVKGAITSISPVGSEGFVLVAQGQKCLVRGLKEDGTILPVAFVDTQCYLSVAKELDGTGLCILGDAVKGVWLAGYNEDPYQLHVFGKSLEHIQVASADFLPDGKHLYMDVIDTSGSLHVFHFDPQHPKSLGGQRLLHLCTFHTGAYPTTMTLLPRQPCSHEMLQVAALADDTDAPRPAEHQILVTTHDGSLALLTPLAASTYRVLIAMQSYLTATITHDLGLNPRGYRNVEANIGVGGRAVVDGDMLRHWMDLGSWKRAEGVARCGAESEWELRGSLEAVSGRGFF